MALLKIRNVHVVRSAGLWNVLEVLKWVSLVTLTVQNASQALLIRYARIRPKSEMFCSSTAVIWTEVVKLLICIIAVSIEERSLFRCIIKAFDLIVRQPMDTLKVCVPSLIYTLQNNLLYVAVSNLSATTFLVTYQLKILTTAIFSVTVLRRSLSRGQWLSLLILFIGVSIVQLQEQAGKANHSEKVGATAPHRSPRDVVQTSAPVFSNSTSPAEVTLAAVLPGAGDPHLRPQNQLLGLFAALCCVIMSGFAGVYFEKILKGSDISVWMRNIQLSVLAIPLSWITMEMKEGKFVREHGLFYGYDGVVWAVVVWYAVGGLAVAMCVRYADNILKGFATSVAIILTCLLSMYLFNFHPTLIFVSGVLLVNGAIYLYSISAIKSNGFKPTTTTTSSSESKVDLEAPLAMQLNGQDKATLSLKDTS